MLVKIYNSVNEDDYIKVNIDDIAIIYLLVNGFRSTFKGGYRALLNIDSNGILELYNYDDYIE